MWHALRRIVAAAIVVTVVGALSAPAADARAPQKRPPANSGPDLRSPAVRARLQHIVDLGRFYGIPGMAVAIERGRGRDGSFIETIGDRTQQPLRPINPATKFRIGSVTKTFTATVILQLVDEGKLSLNATLRRWFPNVQFAGDITIRMLLDMRAGIFDEGGANSLLLVEAAAHPDKVWTPDEIVALAVKQGPHGLPNQQFYYSDTNYVILGAIAERVTHRPLGHLIAQRILRPLHMSQTSYPTTTAIPAPAATGYTVTQGQAPELAPLFQPSMLAGAGAMISNLRDMTIWARALGTGALLSRHTQHQRLQFGATNIEYPDFPQLGGPPMNLEYGLGIAALDGYYGHNGIVPGFASELYYNPRTDTSIVILTNSEVLNPAGQYLGIPDVMVVAFIEALEQ